MTSLEELSPAVHEQTLAPRPPAGDIHCAVEAIMLVDEVASTERTQRLGDIEAARENRALRRAIEHAAAAHGGQIGCPTGDGAMLRFPTVLGALLAAIECRRAVSRIRSATTVDPKQIRAGVNVAEIVIDDDAVFGLGIAVAARLCDLAGPDEILVTEIAADLLRPYPCVALELLGPHELRGVDRPVSVWRLVGEGLDRNGAST